MEPQIEDRYIYTTQQGRRILMRVTATDVEPKHGRELGLCVRLISVVPGEMKDTVLWPEDLDAYYWEKVQ